MLGEDEQMYFRKFMLLISHNKSRSFLLEPPAILEEELNMEKDIVWKSYFSDKRRYADIINGIGCGGAPFIRSTDLSDVCETASKM